MDLNKAWNEFGKNDSYTYPSGWLEDELDYTLVENEIVGDWRWGNIIEAVYKSPEGELVGVQYMDAAGDGEVDHHGMCAEFYPVEAHTVTMVKYLKKV
jgi:hypothetical protein